MKKYVALVVTLLLVAAHVRAQVSGIASYLLVGRSTVAAMPAAASVVRGLWIVTDDADCDASTADDGVTVCVDEGATWAALTAGEGGGGGAPDAHATTHQDGGSDEVSVAGLSGLLATPQTPAAHTQASTTISDSTAAGRTLLTAADASAQRTALALGTSAVLNVPAAGNAASGEVVKGNDTRLNDSRTPTSHASTHENAGADELSVAGLSGVLADPQTPATHSHTAAGDVDGDLSTTDLDEVAVESELEAVLDLPDLQGAVVDAQVPDSITISLAATATAFATNGTNCGAGNYPLGVDASGNAEDCTAAGGGVGGSTGASDNRVLRSDGTGGATLQASDLTLSDTASSKVTVGTAASTSLVVLPAVHLFLTSNTSGQVWFGNDNNVYGGVKTGDGLALASNAWFGWGSTAIWNHLGSPSTTLPFSDVRLGRREANVLALVGSDVNLGAALEFSEQTAPSAPAANRARLFIQDNGAGKSQLCARFATGSSQCFASEP